MTSQSPITVPDGTTIYQTSVREARVKAVRRDVFCRSDRFNTTLYLDGNIAIDPAKPVYILQFDDDEETPQ